LLHYNGSGLYTLKVYSERWGKARDHEAFSFFRILVFLWQSALLNVQDTEGSGFELGRTWDLLCSWCLLRWCPDVPLPFICYWLRLGVKFRLCIDNAAARAFFCRSGMGHIRHICLRILWVQSEVKERTILRIGQVTRDNPLDIGTKRLTSLKVTCQILLAFLTICLLARALHSHSGINWRCQFGLFLSLGRLAKAGLLAMPRPRPRPRPRPFGSVSKQGVKMFTQVGASPQDSKRLMRILLLSALGLPDVMAMEVGMVALWQLFLFLLRCFGGRCCARC
jgi:hypothetical protein